MISVDVKQGNGCGERGRLYTCCYTVTARTTPALRWAAMRAISRFHFLWGTKSQDCVHRPQPFWIERRAEAESSQGPSAYQPNAVTLGQTGSLDWLVDDRFYIALLSALSDWRRSRERRKQRRHQPKGGTAQSWPSTPQSFPSPPWPHHRDFRPLRDPITELSVPSVTP